ncbi:IS1182 family transposase [Clostridium chromiireducens]|uniref:IS1182 family transposase n=1 Tax=Clostridium chromiireducens TaxID=225345 RepID=A0A964RTE1_9CLOT|nr:IS1182 family transposase [Clostridium chromiireducens]MVX67440.1 IS1182 family transposase [Clostridium chromiireducens]
MMTRKDVDNRFQIEFNSVDALVPKNHLVRKIDKAIDFNFIYDEVAELYSAFGAPSIDPVVLIKIIMIQYLFGIPSMRQTIREIEVNIAYRWFIGYSFNEKIPHFSTFNKNYERRFKDTDLFNVIFAKILEEADKHGFINLSEIYIDSTHIKASANKRKYTKKEIETEAKKYQDQLEKEIDEDREKHDKKPLKKTEKSADTKVIVESTTDKDSGMFYKNEKEKCFAYLAHTACDNNNYILDFHVTSGNVHDSVGFIDLYKSLKEKYCINDILAIAMDAGYITPYICKTLFDDNILPTLPYKRPMTKDGFFKKYEYVYDEYNDIYICPNDKILKYSTTNRDGYREYKSNPYDCKKCPHINKCTNSKNHQKLVTRHVWEEYVEEANHLRHDRYVNSIYKCRKETIERVFADAKEKHSMRYTHLRGLAKMTMEVTLTFACMNLKKMASYLWKRNGSYRVDSTFNILIIKNLISNVLKSTKSIFLAIRKCFLSTI